MNGPQHYTAGEVLLAQSDEVGARVGPIEAQAIATQAVAHFIAAQVCATVDAANVQVWKMATDGDSHEVANSQQWVEVMK